MLGTSRLDRDKFANTVLYLVKHCPDEPGLTKLLKLLYFADFGHYRKHLRPITGVEYVALPQGPVPNDYKDLFDELEANGAIVRREVPVFGLSKPKVEIEALQEPNEAGFAESEREVLEEVLRKHGNESGKTLSDRAHADGPWSLAWDPENRGQPVPYMLGRWLENQCDEDDLAIAAQALESTDVQEALRNIQ
jgi:uncharacterized phage-associated protein